MAIYSTGQALIGSGESNNSAAVTSFIKANTGASVNINSTPWCGYFAGATVASAGYSIPKNYASSQAWASYGQPVTYGNTNGVQVGDVAVYPVSGGYGHVGVVTGFASDGNPIILSGNHDDKVLEAEETNTSNITFRRPVTADGSTPPADGTNPNGSAQGTPNNKTDSNPANRQGNQLGNTDTQSTNDIIAKSGPRCCGIIHIDIIGTPGNYTQSKIYSSCTRLPTHEPWIGHPISNQKMVSSSGSGSSGGSGGGTGSGGGGGSSGGGNGSTTPYANPSGNEAAKYAYKYFISKGWTPEQAAGIVGGLQVESGNFAASIVNGTRKGDNGTAVGIAQWHPDRQANFARFAGHSIIGAPLSEQLDFVNYEMTQGTEQRAGRAIKATTTASDAAYAADHSYERSSGASTGQRQANANRLLSQYGDGSSIPSPTPDNINNAVLSKGTSTPSGGSSSGNSSGSAASDQQTGDPGMSSNSPGSSKATEPVKPGGGSLNKSHYNPNDSFGQSSNPDAKSTSSNPKSSSGSSGTDKGAGSSDKSTSGAGTSGSNSSNGTDSGSSSGAGTPTSPSGATPTTTSAGSGGATTVTTPATPGTQNNGVTTPAGSSEGIKSDVQAQGTVVKSGSTYAGVIDGGQLYPIGNNKTN